MSPKATPYSAPEGYSTVVEAAARYGVNKHTIYRWIKRGGVVDVRKIGLHNVYVSDASMAKVMGREQGQ